MGSAETVHRLQFAFTVTYHYIFPQLTMGLALLIVVLKTVAIRRKSELANRAVRFWGRILAVTFVMGVVTGIPMEFQFGTNWARFSQKAGGVIGQTLAMEGVFAFFLESSFLYLLLFGEKRLGQRGHWVAALLVFVGTWLSGYFIVATNAWMQHPVGYTMGADGKIALESFWALLGNPWAWWQYLHTMIGAVITGCFVMAALGAFYLLLGKHERHAKLFLRTAIIVGLPATLLAAFPTGDRQAQNVYEEQPVTFAAMEGHFHTQKGAGLVLIGQPNMDQLRLDNKVAVPRVLSFLTHQRWSSNVAGLSSFDRSQWPDNIPLLYYDYHIMVGLGTIFILIMAVSAWSLARGKLYRRRWLLWVLALSAPFPFIANIAGWHAAELGRQPWVIYGVMRTANGTSATVSAGNALFTFLGFLGLYGLLSLLYFFLMTRLIAKGPERGEA